MKKDKTPREISELTDQKVDRYSMMRPRLKLRLSDRKSFLDKGQVFSSKQGVLEKRTKNWHSIMERIEE